ncbi:Protein of unknown function [Cotesia congregata]|uniref:Uncharacterized protein n=1 Tax=Cotesia congregata TaxID=51543 RepID=A0A8J2HMJ4_COTCN|nr:Protein of unknown function [Cotesia congregata]
MCQDLLLNKDCKFLSTLSTFKFLLSKLLFESRELNIFADEFKVKFKRLSSVGRVSHNHDFSPEF